ncbi:MAG: hypothetical protein V2A73_13950 [Pseudomonadota bacterium]
MITAEFRDAGTRPRIVRAEKPGMDRITWLEERSFEEFPAERFIAEQNEAMVPRGEREDKQLDCAPWPAAIGYHAPVDYTQRYTGWGPELLQEVQNLDEEPTPNPERWAPVPGGRALIVSEASFDVTNREHTNASAVLSPVQVQALGPDFLDATAWLRLPFGNEGASGTDLRNALVCRWTGIQNARFTLRTPNDYLFAPFDLGKPDRYTWRTDAGEEMEHGRFFSQFSDRAQLVVYLRPRRLRYLAKVIAHYVYISWFEEVQNDEVFLQAWFDRPPFYPVRHTLRQSIGHPLIWHPYEGVELSYDAGVDSKFTHSRAAGELRDQILDQQWWSLCMAYLFLYAEPAVITVWQYPPRLGECVCGIGRVDRASGHEERCWVIAKEEQRAEYPTQVLDAFWADFWV